MPKRKRVATTVTESKAKRQKKPAVVHPVAWRAEGAGTRSQTKVRLEKQRAEEWVRNTARREAAAVHEYRFGKLLEFLQTPGQQFDLIEKGDISGAIEHKVTCVKPLCVDASRYLKLDSYERKITVLVPGVYNFTAIAYGESALVELGGTWYDSFYDIEDGCPGEQFYSWSGRVFRRGRNLTLDAGKAYFRERVQPLVAESICEIQHVPGLQNMILAYFGSDGWGDGLYSPTWMANIRSQPETRA